MSSLSSCLAKHPDLLCGLPDAFESDGDVAGRGVLIAFIVAVVTSLVGAVLVLVTEGFEFYGDKGRRKWMFRARIFIDGYLVSLSDTQAITTLALLISAYFYLGCSITAYHYDLVCSLVLMSSAAFIGSMVVMHRYFDSRWWLGVLRGALIIACFGLAFQLFRRRSIIFPSYKPHSDIKNPKGGYNTGLVLPATCFIDHPGVTNTSSTHDFTASPTWIMNLTMSPSSNNSSVRRNATVVAPTANASMTAFTTFTSNDDLSHGGDMVALGFLFAAFMITAITNCILLFLEEREAFHQWVAYPVRCGSFLASYIIALYALYRFLELQGWMLKSGWFVDDDGETSVESFGQLMPLILLALPILALAEQYAAEKPTTQRNKDAGYERSNYS
ncbi:hypothetical protein BDV96DRAFT_608094 [Lophiotrema nucula]|uniref:Uncharacterized protein n=1 Tax=Lophiotrema nucula TaxID=690887 RepID=A0A6A5YE97_9PLEO|nr:hypothetical protein BDV96DRAFT_608094 [Lophiotrema nucula]